LKSQYGTFFTFIKLKSQLLGLSSNSIFSNKNLSGIVSEVLTLDVIDVFSEVDKLCKLILTLPYTTASVERSFSALSRIKVLNGITFCQKIFLLLLSLFLILLFSSLVK